MKGINMEINQVFNTTKHTGITSREIINHMDEGIIIINKSGMIIMVNPSAERIVGLGSPALLNKEVSKVFSSPAHELEDPGQFMELAAKIKGDPGQTINEEISYLRPAAHISITSAPVTNRFGNMAGVIIMLRDITERKRAEEELAKIAAEQKNIMGTISDGIYMLDMSGNLVNWNRTAEVVTGLSAEELKGKPIVELFVEEDRASVAEAIRKGLEEGIGEVTGSFLRKDRSPAIYQWSTVPLKDPQGNVIGLTGVGRDITEQKRIEEKYRTLFENSIDGVYTVDIEGNLTSFNKTFAEVLGYPAEAIVGHNFREIMKPVGSRVCLSKIQ